MRNEEGSMSMARPFKPLLKRQQMMNIALQLQEQQVALMDIKSLGLYIHVFEPLSLLQSSSLWEKHSQIVL